MRGYDVKVARLLLTQLGYLSYPISDHYDHTTATAVVQFNSDYGLEQEGLHAAAQSLLLDLAPIDSYIDAGGHLPSPYKYKVLVTVCEDRTIQPIAKLLNSTGHVIHSFRARLKGQSDSNGRSISEFGSDGDTPTGLYLFDLNSPEGDDDLYGPYPVNRATDGLAGNAAIAYKSGGPRSGILLHTGSWDKSGSDTMEDSHGCIHAHQDDIRTIWKKLVALGVEVRENPFGTRPYPFAPQGLLSVQRGNCHNF
eukprot:TRINITY_DN5665_c0_g1_i1.p1 TRINITY_DN5665_c0_g1~~TRINITY_DN5665_c0_g1_i1.p1  ORF type:complete len:277 (-),score=36.25 TRINITY_DN5665_c0_g1_i1:5-760(-)